MEKRIPERVDSKFRYVLVAARRAEQLIRGGRPRLEEGGKPTSVAMEEISQDMIEWDYGPAPKSELELAAEAAAEASAEESGEEGEDAAVM